MNKVKNITAAPVTAKNFDAFFESYLRKNKLVLLQQEQMLQLLQAIAIFGNALGQLERKGILTNEGVDPDAPTIELATR